MASPERPDGAHLSPRSERVRKVAALSGRSVRAKQNAFRVEGPQAVRSLLEAAPAHALEVFLTSEADAAHPELSALAREAGAPRHEVSGEVIAHMVREQGHSSVANPQGVIAVARPVDRPWRQVLDALPAEGPLTVVVCERLQDPGNAGLVLRTADAAGADAVFFGEDSADIYSPKVVRSSVGSLMHVSVARKVPVGPLLAELSRRGIRTAATSPRAATDLFQWSVPERLAWVVGNEARGLTEDTLAACDERVRIPLFGRAESLNLATAATLCLFESARAHRAVNP
ncbi:MAG: RNA methyltransferase [Dermabacter sp.]|nr:RNA methyltransferase [Dermabacter sp.]